MSFNFKKLKVIFIIGFCFTIILFKQYMLIPDPCKSSCKRINSEIDLINCLDACSANYLDLIPNKGISFQKLLFTLSITLILTFILIRFINNMIIHEDNKFFQKIQYLYSYFPNKSIFETLMSKYFFNANDKDYIKLSDHDE